MQVNLQNSRGFTLIELFLALSIFMIVVGAIYSTYLSQQKAYIVQEQIAGIQQNLRAAMFIMSREIRMAGYSSELNEDTVLGITAFGHEDGRDNDSANGQDASDANNEIPMGIQLSYRNDEPDAIDNDNDGTVDEAGEEGLMSVWYSFYRDGNGNDAIGRAENGGNIQAIAENIDALYLTFKDSDNVVITTNPENVASVLITIVGRADRQDFDYTHTDSYDMDGDPTDTDEFPSQNDNFRRRMLSTVVKCRNVGLY